MSPLSPNINDSYNLLPNINLNWLVQLFITILILGLGFIYLLRSTASKYFSRNFDSSISTAMAVEYPNGGADADNKCAVCDKPSKSRCAGCKSVFYCSIDCQSRHWKSEHNKLCKQSRPAQSKSQQSVGEKRRTSVCLIPSNCSDEIKLVDKILFPYDEFVKLFNWDGQIFPPRGLVNCGNSCFANVVLQCLAHTRPLVAYLLRRGHRTYCRRAGWCFLCELEEHMTKACRSEQPFSPINFLSRLPSMGGSNLCHQKQEDAHEFMRFAIDMMQSVCLDEHGGERVIQPKSQETTLIQHIYGGQLQSQVKCTRCSQVSNQYENMMDLIVEIEGHATSLEDCLDQFTAKEMLDGENMYKCDRCKDYVIASKRLSIYQAPNILTVTLKRFEGGIFGKINKKITFPEILDLSPYMSEEGDGSDKYELYAVVVHMDMLNASFFGHYICYTKGFLGHWYWIDDCKVERVEMDEVLSQRAYMLLYKRVSARPNCLKTFEPVVHQNQIVDKMTTVGEDGCPSQRESCSPASKTSVADDNLPTQMASSSNFVEPCSSRSAFLSSDLNQQLNAVNDSLDPQRKTDHGSSDRELADNHAAHSVSGQPASNYSVVLSDSVKDQQLNHVQTSTEHFSGVGHLSALPASIEVLRNENDTCDSIISANDHTGSNISTCYTAPVDVDMTESSDMSVKTTGDTSFVASGAALISDKKTDRILDDTQDSAAALVSQTSPCDMSCFCTGSITDYPLQRSNKKNRTDKYSPNSIEEETLASADTEADMELASVELDESSNCFNGVVGGIIPAAAESPIVT